MMQGENIFIDQSSETHIERTKELGSIYTILIGFTMESEDSQISTQALISHGSTDC